MKSRERDVRAGSGWDEVAVGREKRREERGGKKRVRQTAVLVL